MNFLEKLDYLMEEKGLNPHTLAKASGIPYTTIKGWYEKGYEGLKLPTLRKLSNFFCTTLDYWALDEIKNPLSSSYDTSLTEKESKIMDIYRQLTEFNQHKIEGMIELKLQEQQEEQKQYQIENKASEKFEVHSSIEPAYAVIYRGQLAAGKPIHHYDDLFEVEYMQSPYPAADFAWQVVGDSMEPDIADGSIIYTRTVSREEVRNGDTVVVNINGEYNCKDIYYYPTENLVELRSINPLHETQRYYLGDETDTNLKVEGKVIF